MDNGKIMDLLLDINERLDKITLEEFLNVMTLVNTKIKSERAKLKESKTLSERETNKLVSLYENIKNYLFDIFSQNEDKLSSVKKITLLQEKIKKYLSSNNSTINQIASTEMDQINKQCEIVKLDDIDEKINNIKENSKTISIDEFDAIYECMEKTLKLLYETVNKINQISPILDKKSIKKDEERVVEIIKQLEKVNQIFNKKKGIVEEQLILAINSDDEIPLVEKVSPMIKIGKIYEKIIEHIKEISININELKSLIDKSEEFIEQIKKGKLSDEDNIFIKDIKEKMSKYAIEANDLEIKIENSKNNIEINKNKAYDNLAGRGLIKYEDYNNYINIAGSDEKKIVAPLNDEFIREVLNNNIRLLGNITLEELYYIIDKVKNYLFANQHFISKGILGVKWNFTKNDLDKYIENPKQGVNNSSWPVKDTNVPPLPNCVQLIALYLKVLISVSDLIFKELRISLQDNDNLRTTLKTLFVDNNSYKNVKVNTFKYNGKDFKDAIKKDSDCNFYIDDDNSKTKPESQYFLSGGNKYNDTYLKKYIKYKQKYINVCRKVISQ